MLKKIATGRVALLILVPAFGIYILYSFWVLFIPRHGKVVSVSALQNVYSKAGPQIAATFTNSIIQKFPFDGPIDWQLSFFKEPLIILTGRVDTNALHEFISDHATTRFLWSGAGNEIEEGWPSGKEYPTATWTNIFFHTEWVVEGYEASIRGTVDLRSSIATVRSSGSDQPVRANQ